MTSTKHWNKFVSMGRYCDLTVLDHSRAIDPSIRTNLVCPPVNIRTVKVTKSKAADNIAAGESAVNDPNVMHKVRSPYPGDISKVLDALEHKQRHYLGRF